MYVYPSDVPDGANPQTSGVEYYLYRQAIGVTKIYVHTGGSFLQEQTPVIHIAVVFIG